MTTMDPNDENLSEPFSEDPSQPHPAPVMDVVPPPAAVAKTEANPKHPAEGHQLDSKAMLEPTRAAKTPAAAASAPAQTAQPPGNGVAAAIVATVIVVLGLAGLAVFAYLKSQ